jgi:hypothetical protein
MDHAKTHPSSFLASIEEDETELSDYIIEDYY